MTKQSQIAEAEKQKKLFLKKLQDLKKKAFEIQQQSDSMRAQAIQNQLKTTV